MELGTLIEALRPEAADVVQTHISVVFLTGPGAGCRERSSPGPA